MFKQLFIVSLLSSAILLLFGMPEAVPWTCVWVFGLLTVLGSFFGESNKKEIK